MAGNYLKEKHGAYRTILQIHPLVIILQLALNKFHSRKSVFQCRLSKQLNSTPTLVSSTEQSYYNQ